MVLKKKSRLIFTRGVDRDGVNVVKRVVVYVPMDVARDSAFPFGEGDEVDVEIADGKLIVSKG